VITELTEGAKRKQSYRKEVEAGLALEADLQSPMLRLVSEKRLDQAKKIYGRINNNRD